MSGRILFRVLMIATFGAALGSSSSWAAGLRGLADSGTASAAKTVNLSGTFKGNGSSLMTSTEACTVGYSNQCPSGACTCLQINGTMAAGIAGKGTGTLYVTLDNGNPAGRPFTDSAGTFNPCEPFYGELVFTTTKDTEDWDTVGSICSSFTDKLPIVGGWGLGSSSLFTIGFGTASGSLVVNSSGGLSSMSIKFVGKAQ